MKGRPGIRQPAPSRLLWGEAAHSHTSDPPTPDEAGGRSGGVGPGERGLGGTSACSVPLGMVHSFPRSQVAHLEN